MKERISNISKFNTSELIPILLEMEIYDIRLSYTVEGGICVKIWNNLSHVMYIELYNDGDKGYIIEDTLKKKVLDNDDFKSFDVLKRVIKKFIER